MYGNTYLKMDQMFYLDLRLIKLNLSQLILASKVGIFCDGRKSEIPVRI